jgi:hypothetical protein
MQNKDEMIAYGSLVITVISNCVCHSLLNATTVF